MARTRRALLVLGTLVLASSYAGAHDHHLIHPRADAGVLEVATDEHVPHRVLSTLSRDERTRASPGHDDKHSSDDKKHDEEERKVKDEDHAEDEDKKSHTEERGANVKDVEPSDADKRADKDNTKSHDQDQKPHDQDQKSQDQDQKSHDQDQKPHDQNQKSHDQDQKSQDQDQKSHDQDQKSHDEETRTTTRPNELNPIESIATHPVTGKENRTEQGEESAATESAVPKAVPELNPPVSEASHAPVAVLTPTPIPATVALEPSVSAITPASPNNTVIQSASAITPGSPNDTVIQSATPITPASPSDTVIQSATPVPMIQTSSEFQHNPGFVDEKQNGTSGSTNTHDAMITSVEGAPLASTIAPTTAHENGSAPAHVTDGRTPVPALLDRSGNPASSLGDEKNHRGSDTESLGHVHASASGDVSASDHLDGVESSHAPSSPATSRTNDEKVLANDDAGILPTKGSRASNDDTNRSNNGHINGLGALFNPAVVSDVKTSSAAYYKLDTGSIIAIVGVVVGLVGILVLFVTISRKKYTEEEDRSPLPYGYNVNIRAVVRPSPTFMEEDSVVENTYDTSNQLDTASSPSGDSSDDVVVGNTTTRNQPPAMPSDTGNVDPANVRVSALYSAGSSLTDSSAVSGTWSSVLASDTERDIPRNTRDTSLSAWSSSYFSSVGSVVSNLSAFYRTTRSSSMLSSEMSYHGNSGVLSRSVLCSTNPSTDADRVAFGSIESSPNVFSADV
ncbi:hypothetical protein PsorP6_010873 [Peronosclerospora sorghi]|uniref:Uncharacterized protein n=1 Tax=Peronosclerospora sorghi TaxID=230839 RepID=A0ACC0VZ28_9STRA|nr:hypothetical protein PsorP6_010873 [Peronosclerospora sorghi]